jgi:uncharacterized membrane protein
MEGGETGALAGRDENVAEPQQQSKPNGGSKPGNWPYDSDPANARAQRAAGVNVGKIERVASSVLGAALIMGGLKSRSLGGMAAALAGSGMLYRGMSGHCHVFGALGVSTAGTETSPSQGDSEAPRVQRTVTIDKPASELYNLWRDAGALRRVMQPFADVSSTSDRTARWSIRTPLGKLYSCETEIVEDRNGELLRWRSVDGSGLLAEGTLRLAPALGNRGTRVSLALRLDPPGGRLGAVLMKALRVVPDTIARAALQRFKSLAETGEIPTTEGSPSARSNGGAWASSDKQDRLARALGCFSIGLGLAELMMPRRMASWIGAPDRSLLFRMLGLREIVSGIGILSKRQRSAWLWSRVAGDAVDLTLLGTALKSRDSNVIRLGAAATAVAGVTAIDALTSWRYGRRNGTAANRPYPAWE